MANMQDIKCQCKKLVPLTDEEIKTIFESNIKHDISDAFGFARAIEAAHGITGAQK